MMCTFPQPISDWIGREAAENDIPKTEVLRDLVLKGLRWGGDVKEKIIKTEEIKAYVIKIDGKERIIE